MQVPVIGMGTWRTFNVRGRSAEAHRRSIVETALAAGANLFDSSPMYGEAERVLADALEGRRERAIIATKVWTGSVREGRRQIERALSWFGGYVDIYQVHNLVAWEQHLPVLEDLRARGKIGIIGATHYSHASFDEL
jgi:aryl-alcohol dehydrogenase-like predicted oxidoreductase